MTSAPMKKIRLQAHRGVSSEFPENTLSAFRAAVEEGYGIIELDPKYTSDNHIVILHDRTVNRTGRQADGSELPPDMKIAQVSFAQAREWDFGIWMAPDFRGEKLPSLEEVIDFIHGHDIAFKFDNVWESFPDAPRERFLTQLENAQLGGKLGFTCAQMERLQEIVQRFPEAEIHWDGTNEEETLQRVAALAHGHRLTIWVCYDNEEAWWFKGAKATKELCSLAHRYGELGIWLLAKEENLEDTIRVFHADAIETTGDIKPSMLLKYLS